MGCLNWSQESAKKDEGIHCSRPKNATFPTSLQDKPRPPNQDYSMPKSPRSFSSSLSSAQPTAIIRSSYAVAVREGLGKLVFTSHSLSPQTTLIFNLIKAIARIYMT